MSRTSLRLLALAALCLIWGAAPAIPRHVPVYRSPGAKSDSACDRSRGPELFLAKQQSKLGIRKVAGEQRLTACATGADAPLTPPRLETFAADRAGESAGVVIRACTFHERAPPA
jgi:hypothetical protein